MSSEGDSFSPEHPATDEAINLVYANTPAAEVVGSNLSEFTLQRAAVELGETDSTRSQSLATLRDLILYDPQLDCRTDYAFLIKFLRHRKLNVESAHQRIRAYLQVRNHLADVFTNFNPEGIRPVLESHPSLFCLLPERDAEGRLLVLCRVGEWDCDRVSRTELLRTVGVLMEAALQEEETQVNGVSIILDLHGLKWHQIRNLQRDSYLNRIHEVISKALPVRVKQIHIVRAGRIFDVAFRLLSFLLSSKMRQRLQNHGTSLNSLHKAIEPRLLPRDPCLGGTMDPSLDQALRTQPFGQGRKFDLLTGRWNAWFEENNKQKFIENPAAAAAAAAADAKR